MYYCYVHNWSSPSYSCPSCHKLDYSSSNSATMPIPLVKLEGAISFKENEREKAIREVITALMSEDIIGLDVRHNRDVAKWIESNFLPGKKENK